MLDKTKLQAINLLVENKHKKTDIAEMCGIARQTLYDWLKNEEFKKELDKRLTEIQTYGVNQIKANLYKNISHLQWLAKHAESEKIQADATQYLIDRVLGKTTTKIDLEAEAKTTDTPIDDTTIDQELEDEDE